MHMTRQQAVERASVRLVPVSDNPGLEAQLLVCFACRMERSGLFAHPDVELSSTEETTFETCFSSRLQGKPLAYITGHKEFWSLDFTVNEHVLIPRPETELLVEVALRLIPDLARLRILDLGTGCGAIAVAIAKERQHCRVVATDISEAALEVAKLNATRNGVDIAFVHSDWFTTLEPCHYDVIVSNPPYVAENDPDLDAHVAEHEPSLALISGKSGLQDIERIIGQATRYLDPRGSVLIEHGFQQGADARRLLQQHGFAHIHTYRDHAGLERVSCAHPAMDRT